MATPGSLGGGNVFGTGYVSLQALLGRPELQKMIDETLDGIPDPFPAPFWGDMNTVESNYAQAFADIGMRELAPIVAYDGKSIVLQEVPLGQTLFTLMASRFNYPLNVTDYMNLINFEDLDRQAMGMKEVGRQMKKGLTRLKNLRQQILASVLFLGNTYIDKSGGILPSSTNALYTANAGIPTGNTGQLNVFGTGNFLTVGWENTGTAVPDLDVLNLRQASVRLTGYTLRHALYGINVPGYLAMNSRLSPYFYRDVFRSGGTGQTYIDSGELAMGLLGLSWLPAWASFYIKGQEYPLSTPSLYASANPLSGPSLYPNNVSPAFAGQIASMVGASAVTFVPDPDECPFIRHYEGKYPIPNKWGPQRMTPEEMESARFMADDHDIEAGIWCYAYPGHDPTTITLYFGDTYGCWAQIPQAIFQGTVNF